MTSDDELLHDYLDELLEPEEARAAEAAIARDPARFAEVARRRALLYRPYAVPPPRARKPALRLLRYAAVFLLGVLTPLLFPLPPRPPDPPKEPAKLEVTNRRLR
jgi:anti-sigma factor RsiW